MTEIPKWKQAVIHFECAADSEDYRLSALRIDALRARLEGGDITREQFAAERDRGSRQVRLNGTALFIRDQGRRYLITARHVVWDERTADRQYGEYAQNTIFEIIFRVPSLDEYLAGRRADEFLVSLGAGTSNSLPYTFSAPDIDLACISLDQRDSRFADELEARGYVPVDSSVIADGPNFEGEELFTIGFPSSTAIIGRVGQGNPHPTWSSSQFSLPVAAFGRVSMLHDALPFYWADMSIYPGNSGGPVVAGDRLVGIVSGQATLAIDGVPSVLTRIPFAKVMKVGPVRSLLSQQQEKDRRNA